MESAGEKVPVYVTASFMDRNSLFLETLTLEEIQVFENDEPRNLRFMAQSEIPTVYGVLFDLAMFPESIEDERAGARGISSAAMARSLAYEIIDKLIGRQAVWVGIYEQDLRILIDVAIDGSRAKALIAQVRGRRRPEESFLFPALFSAVQKMNGRHEKRRVIVLFLDGLDVRTSEKLKPLKNLLSYSNVELFVIYLGSKLVGERGGLPPAMGLATLKELAEVTSGDLFANADYRDHPEDLIRRMLNHMRTFYTLGFDSQPPEDRAGKLRIRCLLPGSKARHHPVVPRLQFQF